MLEHDLNPFQLQENLMRGSKARGKICLLYHLRLYICIKKKAVTTGVYTWKVFCLKQKSVIVQNLTKRSFRVEMGLEGYWQGLNSKQWITRNLQGRVEGILVTAVRHEQNVLALVSFVQHCQEFRYEGTEERKSRIVTRHPTSHLGIPGEWL